MSTTHTTKAIVLRTVVFGDTSIIVSALTEMFGIQSYLIKGVRTATKKQSAKASYFQPGSILDMTVYHHPTKQLNFVKDFRFAYLYQNVFSNVIKNSVALYCVEVMTKCLKQPDDNPDYYFFLEKILMLIDSADSTTLANLPIYYCFELLQLQGLMIMDNYTEQQHILDLLNGQYVSQPPTHINYVDLPVSKLIYDLSQNDSIEHLNKLNLNAAIRRQILHSIELFYQLHISDFGKIKSLEVLSTILSG